MRFHIPIRLPSLANTRMDWRRMSRLKVSQRGATAACMHGHAIPSLPLLVTITRVGPRQLDDDNLASACKYIRDEIARAVGVDDGSPLYTWRYEQRIGDYGVDVEVMSSDME